MVEKVIIPTEVTNAINNLLRDGWGAEEILVNVAQSLYSENNFKVLTDYVFDGTGLDGRFLNLVNEIVNKGVNA